MNIYTLDLAHYNKLSSTIAANVLTIGNFDGVHRGHQAMLAQLKQSAHTISEQDKGTAKLQTMVMVFEPQPREYFATLNGNIAQAPARLTSLDEKIQLLDTFGIDNIIVAHFDESFRSLSAHDFADLLVDKLSVKALVLGDDFRFGHDRIGDSHFLRDYGLPVTNLHTITDTNSIDIDQNTENSNESGDVDNQNKVSDTRISSTRIRECLADGDLSTANHLLGHDYTMIGEVIHGDKIGRTLDFPTANITLNRVKPALHGIFAVDVVIIDENGEVVKNGFDLMSGSEDTSTNGVKGLRPHSLFGTANIGTRPSVDKPHDWRLEVHFPKFSGELYGITVDVRFLHYLHGERKYTDLEALKAGIKQDVVELLAWREKQNSLSSTSQ